MAVTIAAWRYPCCCVRSSRNGSSMTTSPGDTEVSSAPMVCITRWRAKLARTRCSNSGSAGVKTCGPGGVLATLIDVLLPQPLCWILRGARGPRRSVEEAGDSFPVHGADGNLREQRHREPEPGEALVLGQPLSVAEVDLLGDDRDLEQAQHVVEHHVVHGPAAQGGIALDDLLTGQVAGQCRRSEGSGGDHLRLARLEPVGERQARGRERVPA